MCNRIKEILAKWDDFQRKNPRTLIRFGVIALTFEYIFFGIHTIYSLIPDLYVILPRELSAAYYIHLTIRNFHTELNCQSMFILSIFYFIWKKLSQTSTVFLIIFKMNSMKTGLNKCNPYICVALFLLCEVSLGLNLIIIRTLLPFFQTDMLSTVVYALVMFILISYMTMNILNHLQLIYWEFREVSVELLLHSGVAAEHNNSVYHQGEWRRIS